MTGLLVEQGVSDAARHVHESMWRAHRALQQSAAMGIEDILREDLFDAWTESNSPDWNGYEAVAVSSDACREMTRFLEALPLGINKPTIAPDPRGCLSVEWYRNPRRVLSISVSNDNLHYAALLGANKTYGTEAFFGQIPQNILELIRRVYS